MDHRYRLDKRMPRPSIGEYLIRRLAETTASATSSHSRRLHPLLLHVSRKDPIIQAIVCHAKIVPLSAGPSAYARVPEHGRPLCHVLRWWAERFGNSDCPARNADKSPVVMITGSPASRAIHNPTLLHIHMVRNLRIAIRQCSSGSVLRRQPELNDPRRLQRNCRVLATLWRPASSEPVYTRFAGHWFTCGFDPPVVSAAEAVKATRWRSPKRSRNGPSIENREAARATHCSASRFIAQSAEKRCGSPTFVVIPMAATMLGKRRRRGKPSALTGVSRRRRSAAWKYTK